MRIANDLNHPFYCGVCKAGFSSKEERDEHKYAEHAEHYAELERSLAVGMEERTLGNVALVDAPVIPTQPEGDGSAGAGSSGPVVTRKLTDAEAEQIIREHDGKFEDYEMTQEISSWALGWLKAYEGDFEFLVELRSKLKADRLWPGQARGVMNCARAGLFRGEWGSEKDKPKEPKADNGKQSDGTYKAQPGFYLVDGEYVKVQENKNQTAVYAKVLVDDGGPKPGWEYRKGYPLDKCVTPLSAEEAARFGHGTKRCIFCLTELTDDGPNKSVHVGYGPKCAEKHGLPWG